MQDWTSRRSVQNTNELHVTKTKPEALPKQRVGRQETCNMKLDACRKTRLCSQKERILKTAERGTQRIKERHQVSFWGTVQVDDLRQRGYAREKKLIQMKKLKSGGRSRSEQKENPNSSFWQTWRKTAEFPRPLRPALEGLWIIYANISVSQKTVFSFCFHFHSLTSSNHSHWTY